MRRKQKTTREYEKQIGGFVPDGIVRGQSKQERSAFPQAVEQPSAPEPEIITEPESTPRPTEKEGK